jgi:hypothetical protein
LDAILWKRHIISAMLVRAAVYFWLILGGNAGQGKFQDHLGSFA